MTYDDPGDASLRGPSVRAADLVGQLWRDAARHDQSATTTVPDMPATTRMIHDADLLYLTGHRDLDLPDLLAHVIPLLTTLAERRDELVAEIRLLREAIVSESARLAERDDVLHHLLEARLDQLGGGDGEPG